MDGLIMTCYVPELDTLDVWFGDMDAEVESKEVGDGIILKLGENGEEIGVEIVGLSKTSKEDLAGLPFEVRKMVLEIAKKMSVATARLS